MRRALLIDDDATVRATLSQLLPALGYTVTAAENGLAGLDAIRDVTPDIVITDIMMPDMDGIEFIIHVRRHYGDVPVIAVSGGGRVANINFLEMAKGLGATRVIPKPFGLAELQEALNFCSELKPA